MILIKPIPTNKPFPHTWILFLVLVLLSCEQRVLVEPVQTYPLEDEIAELINKTNLDNADFEIWQGLTRPEVWSVAFEGYGDVLDYGEVAYSVLKRNLNEDASTGVASMEFGWVKCQYDDPIAYQILPVSAYDEVQFQFKARQKSGSPVVHARLHFLSAKGDYLYSSLSGDNSTLNSSWRSITVSATAPIGNDRVVLGIKGRAEDYFDPVSGESGVALIDDASFVRIPGEAPPPV